MNTIAFTGHRPKDLPGVTFQTFAAVLDDLDIHRRRDGIHFVTGGALGTDQWAAIYAMQRGITHTLITPFPLDVMGKLWSPTQQQTLHSIAITAQEHIIITDRYDVRAYQQRNEAMVDRADMVFALYTGKQGGGTYNCIKYTLANTDKSVYNLWPLDGKLHRIREVL